MFIYRAPTGPDGFCKMFQQFGRAGRDGKTPVLAVLMMEKTHSDATKRESAKRRKISTTTAQAPVPALMNIDSQSPQTTVIPPPATPVTPLRHPLQDRTNRQLVATPTSHVQGRREGTIATSQPTPTTSRKRKAKDETPGDNQIIPEIMDFANSGEPSRPLCKRNPTVEEYFGNVGLQGRSPQLAPTLSQLIYFIRLNYQQMLIHVPRIANVAQIARDPRCRAAIPVTPITPCLPSSPLNRMTHQRFRAIPTRRRHLPIMRRPTSMNSYEPSCLDLSG